MSLRLNVKGLKIQERVFNFASIANIALHKYQARDKSLIMGTAINYPIALLSRICISKLRLRMTDGAIKIKMLRIDMTRVRIMR